MKWYHAIIIGMLAGHIFSSCIRENRIQSMIDALVCDLDRLIVKNKLKQISDKEGE